MDSFETSTRMRSDEEMFSDDVTMVTGLDNWTTGLSPPPPPPPHIAALKQANKITLIVILVFLMLAMGCVVQPRDFKEVFRVPKSVLIGMLCQFLLMPAVCFLPRSRPLLTHSHVVRGAHHVMLPRRNRLQKKSMIRGLLNDLD
eukprot:XP_011669173.1 PREDICTED: uncharacterized protein LOC105440563 [Strongylocentrotus purpuratus]